MADRLFVSVRLLEGEETVVCVALQDFISEAEGVALADSLEVSLAVLLQNWALDEQSRAETGVRQSRGKGSEAVERERERRGEAVDWVGKGKRLQPSAHLAVLEDVLEAEALLDRDLVLVRVGVLDSDAGTSEAVADSLAVVEAVSEAVEEAVSEAVAEAVAETDLERERVRVAERLLLLVGEDDGTSEGEEVSLAVSLEVLLREPGRQKRQRATKKRREDNGGKLCQQKREGKPRGRNVSPGSP